jgi:hypothetical protein
MLLVDLVTYLAETVKRGTGAHDPGKDVSKIPLWGSPT